MATHSRRLSAMRTLTKDESGMSPTRIAQSKPLLSAAIADLAHVHQSELDGAGGVLEALRRFH